MYKNSLKELSSPLNMSLKASADPAFMEANSALKTRRISRVITLDGEMAELPSAIQNLSRKISSKGREGERNKSMIIYSPRPYRLLAKDRSERGPYVDVAT